MIWDFPEDQAESFRWSLRSDTQIDVWLLIIDFGFLSPPTSNLPSSTSYLPSATCYLLMLLWKRLTYIQWRERHEYIRLQKCDQEFEEPEWEGQDTKCSRMQWWDHLTDIDRHRDEDHPHEDIEKESHREGSDTDEFSSKVQPPDKDTYDLLRRGISMIMEKIVFQLMHRSLHFQCCELGNHDHREGEYESRREVWVDRPEIGSEPLITWDEHEKVHHETEEISEKYHDHESAEEPDIAVCHPDVSEESTDIGDEPRDDIETKCFQTGEAITLDRIRKDPDQHKKKCHKNPCREDRIRDMDTSDWPISDISSMRSGDMRTDVFCCCMCRFWCIHRFWNRARVYEKRIFLQAEIGGKEKSSKKEDYEIWIPRSASCCLYSAIYARTSSEGNNHKRKLPLPL